MPKDVEVKLDKQALAELTVSPESQHLLDRCAERALDFQKATVPVDTGTLRRHLEIDAPTPNTRRVGVIRPHPPRKDATQYALPVEEGHRTRSGTWVHAQPFIRPSINAAKRGLQDG